MIYVYKVSYFLFQLWCSDHKISEGATAQSSGRTRLYGKTIGNILVVFIIIFIGDKYKLEQFVWSFHLSGLTGDVLLLCTDIWFGKL